MNVKLISFICLSMWMACESSNNSTSLNQMPQRSATRQIAYEQACPCPIQLLIHSQSRMHKNEWKAELKLPNFSLKLIPRHQLEPGTNIYLGEGSGHSDRSVYEETNVQPGSRYEEANILANALCAEWQILCLKDLPKQEVDQWMQKVYVSFSVQHNSKQPESANRRSSRQPAIPGLYNIRRTHSGLSFFYGYEGTLPAQLKLHILYMKHGKWLRLHRDDIVFPLQNRSRFSVDLANLGFHQLPAQWDFELYLIKPGSKVKIYPGHRKGDHT